MQNTLAKPGIAARLFALVLLTALTTPVYSQAVTASFPLPGFPEALAINPVTNQIYIATSSSLTAGQVVVVDGATNKITKINTGRVTAIAVNPVTNKIYAGGTQTVTVLDGASNGTTSVAAGKTTRPCRCRH